MNLGFKTLGIEYLLTKLHHGMLPRMMSRMITLGTQNMARLLGDPLRYLGQNNSSNIYVKATEYLNRPVSVLILTKRTSGMEGKDLQMQQTV